EAANSNDVAPHLLPNELVELTLAPESGSAAAIQIIVLTSRRLIGFRSMGFFDLITTFPYSCFVAIELHDSARARESQVHLRLSGSMDPARVLPYLQVTERGAFERVWSFASRTTARRAYNTMVEHIT
ncbi:MAG: hypothetical protein ACKVVP_02345, partial [Chloroflexota bacterium]